MEDHDLIDAMYQLYYQAKGSYGDEVESFWFYDNQEICPCCSKRKIDQVKMGKESGISLNAFMYHDLNVLIIYFLCSRCIHDLPGTSPKQKIMYNRLEQNLKDAYNLYLKSSAS